MQNNTTNNHRVQAISHPDSSPIEDQSSVILDKRSAKLSALISTLRTATPAIVAACPGNSYLVEMPDGDHIAAAWFATRKRLMSPTVVEVEVPVRLLLRASESLTDARQWEYLMCVLYGMQESKTGIAAVHSLVRRDVLPSRLDSAVTKLLRDKNYFSIAMKHQFNTTATLYSLTDQPDPKAPSIDLPDFSKKTDHRFPNTNTDNDFQQSGWRNIEVVHSLLGLACGLVGNIEVVESEKLRGRYRVQSVRMLVDLDTVWSAVEASMVKRWGHIKAAAVGAGMLDRVSEREALEIVERHLRPSDDEQTRQAQRQAALDFVRYVGLPEAERIRLTKWRGGRIYIPGMNLRRGIREELFLFDGQGLASVDVSACYWWLLSSTIRQALLGAGGLRYGALESVERFMDLAANDELYKYFAKKIGTKEEKVKKQMAIVCLFNRHRLGGPLWNALESEFPEIAGVIRRLRDQAGKQSTVARILNNLEGQLMNEPLKALAAAGIPVVRLHDGLLVPDKYVDDACHAIWQRGAERFGALPGLKIKLAGDPDKRVVCGCRLDYAPGRESVWELALPPEAIAMSRMIRAAAIEAAVEWASGLAI